MKLSSTEWDIAQRVCTERQVRILNYSRRGWGARSIASAVDLDESTVRQHIAAGIRKINHELIRLAASQG